jgi:amino acid adenylation domain-containing protein
MSSIELGPQRFDVLHGGFVASVARWSDRPALLLGEQSWTYSEISHTAHRLREALLTVANAPERVGILARRSISSYAGVIGALLAGAAFVPLNPTLPVARLRAIVDVADLDAIICERQHVPLLEKLLEGCQAAPPSILTDGELIDIARVGSSAGLREFPRNTVVTEGRTAAKSQEIAYILFTSGSTGAPKGVPISHANVVSFLKTNLARYGLGPGDILSQTFEQSFDLSVFDMFMAWSVGAALCGFTPTELLAPLSVVRSRKITVWFSVPSVIAVQMRLGLLLPDSLPSLRLSLFCGEPLVREHVEAWHRAAPKSVIENLYGPTELTIACTAYRWNSASSPRLCVNGIVPIGQLHGTLCLRIVDENLKPVATGTPGELTIAGPQSFAGYWRNPKANEAAFYEVNEPMEPPARFYRTGDLVRELPGGDIAFIGRLDQQVKLGGYRIELGEIEAGLRAQPGVAEAVALAWPPNAAVVEKIVAVASGQGLVGDTLRTRLRTLLPAYMIPARVEIVETMPRTSSGKLDRRALGNLLGEQVHAITEGATDAR